MRTASQIVAPHAQAQRAALAMVTGTAVLAFVLTAAFVAERQQARQDLVMQETRGPVNSGDIGEERR